MNKKAFWLSVVAIVISFAGGFLLANALNRKEMDTLRAEVGRLKNLSQSLEETQSQQTLSNEEIRLKIAEADKNPENIEFQKSLAIALYSYASMKQELDLLPEAARLLERVHKKNPKDYSTILAIGNIYFDIGQSKNEAKDIQRSREFYQKALDIKPNDADARTDLGMTYLLATPAENEKAIIEFEKSLQTKPKDERTLQNLIRAFINSGKTKEAEDFLVRLKQANPNNEALSEMESQLAQKKNIK